MKGLETMNEILKKMNKECDGIIDDIKKRGVDECVKKAYYIAELQKTINGIERLDLDSYPDANLGIIKSMNNALYKLCNIWICRCESFNYDIYEYLDYAFNNPNEIVNW